MPFILGGGRSLRDGGITSPHAEDSSVSTNAHTLTLTNTNKYPHGNLFVALVGETPAISAIVFSPGVDMPSTRNSVKLASHPFAHSDPCSDPCRGPCRGPYQTFTHFLLVIPRHEMYLFPHTVQNIGETHLPNFSIKSTFLLDHLFQDGRNLVMTHNIWNVALLHFSPSYPFGQQSGFCLCLHLCLPTNKLSLS